ncbi:MAG: aminoacyl-tRNA hydrolase [bacterium]|nr:aminoacyl-tRNA hydrolase [bacterium]
MWLVVGLGNPGIRYSNTRHNLGFMVVDRLAEQLGIPLRQHQCHSLTGKGKLGVEEIVLAKPLTYMNQSGIAVRELLHRLQLSPSSLIVISDDFHLPLGKLRIRRQGTSGGHHGLESIAEQLGTTQFMRVRIGIGKPEGNEVVDFVLSEFSAQEMEQITLGVMKAAEAVMVIIKYGITQAMNQYN